MKENERKKEKERKKKKERKKEQQQQQNGYFYGQFSRLREMLAEVWEHFLQ